MIVHDALDRQLTVWLEEGAGAAAPDYLDETLSAIGSLRQRPSWRFPARWLPGILGGRRATISRPIVGLAILGLLLAAGLVAMGVAGRRPSVPVRLPPPYGLAATGLLAFDSDGRIVLAEPNGSRTYTLHPSEMKQSGATFSRDGTRVAFAGGRLGARRRREQEDGGAGQVAGVLEDREAAWPSSTAANTISSCRASSLRRKANTRATPAMAGRPSSR